MAATTADTEQGAKRYTSELEKQPRPAHPGGAWPPSAIRTWRRARQVAGLKKADDMGAHLCAGHVYLVLDKYNAIADKMVGGCGPGEGAAARDFPRPAITAEG